MAGRQLVGIDPDEGDAIVGQDDVGVAETLPCASLPFIVALRNGQLTAVGRDFVAGEIGRERPVEFGRSGRRAREGVADLVLADVDPDGGHGHSVPFAEGESVLSVDDLHRDLGSVQISRIAVTSDARAEAAEASVRVVLGKEKGSVTASVASRI